jgi:hypothetical protein
MEWERPGPCPLERSSPRMSVRIASGQAGVFIFQTFPCGLSGFFIAKKSSLKIFMDHSAKIKGLGMQLFFLKNDFQKICAKTVDAARKRW